MLGDGITNATTLTVNGTAEIGSLVTLYDNLNPVGTFTADASGHWSITESGLTSGSIHNFTATAADKVGNISSPTAPLSVTIVTGGPTEALAITAIAADSGTSGDFVTNDTTLIISGTNGTLAAGDKIQVSSDNGTTWTDVVQDTATTWTLVDGSTHATSFTYQARIVDAASNIGTTASQAVTIDTTAPAAPSITSINDDALPVTGVVADNGSSNDTTLTINGTAEAGSTVTLYDTNGTTLGTGVAAGGFFSITTTPLSQVAHTITAKATDIAGNQSPASVAFHVTIDTTAPAAGTLALTNFSDTGSSGSDFISQDKSFDLSLSGQESGSAVVYQISTNGGGIWTTTSAAQSNLADGNYQFRAQVTDAAGNTSTGNVILVTVDSTAPAAGTLALANFSDTGSSGSDFISQDKTFDLSLSGQESGSTVVYQVSTNGGGTWTTTTAAQSNLADGNYQFRAQVTDTVGNTSTGNVISVAVDSTAPAAGTLALANFSDTGSSGSDFISQDKSFDLSLSGQESGSTVVYQVSTNGGGTWTTTTAAQNNLADDNYQFRTQVTDAAGNTSIGNVVAVTVDSTAPTVSITSAGGSTNQVVQTITGTVDVAAIGTTVTLFDNGGTTPLGTAVVQNDGSWTPALRCRAMARTAS